MRNRLLFASLITFGFPDYHPYPDLPSTGTCRRGCLDAPGEIRADGHHIVAALSSNLYHQQPVGLAFAAYYAGVGELHNQWADLREELNNGDTSVRDTLTRLRLTALDRQSLVLLGDPTVTMPLLPP
jgi:hypothetical protein